MSEKSRRICAVISWIFTAILYALLAVASVILIVMAALILVAYYAEGYDGVKQVVHTIADMLTNGVTNATDITMGVATISAVRV